MIEFLEDCIGSVKAETKKQSGLQLDKQDLLLRLIEKKKQAESSKKPKKQAPMPPDFGNTTPNKEIRSSLVCNTQEGDINTVQSNTSYMTAQTTVHSNTEQEEAPAIPQCQRTPTNDQRMQSLPHQSSSESQKIQAEVRKSPSQSNIRQTPTNSPIKKKGSLCDINSHTAYQLLDQVRRNTQLSYEMSKVAVTVVVSGLQQLLPQNVSYYFDALLHQLETPFTVSQMSIEETYDANRLKVIFTELTSCKEDSQQRNWMLYEDESIIVDYIKELTSILVYHIFIALKKLIIPFLSVNNLLISQTNADANVSRYVLQQNQYNGVNILIQYYQMEPRWTIRQLLLQSFGVMCSLDSVILTIMLNSILPMELAR